MVTILAFGPAEVRAHFDVCPTKSVGVLPEASAEMQPGIVTKSSLTIHNHIFTYTRGCWLVRELYFLDSQISGCVV